jgi:hypothetical protein
MGLHDIPEILIAIGILGLFGLGVHNWKYRRTHPDTQPAAHLRSSRRGARRRNYAAW